MTTPREHALRVAALDALKASVTAEYERARKDAEEAFKTARKDGSRQQEVLLPGGVPAGLISIKEGATVVTADEAALLAWAEAHNHEAVEEYIDPAVLLRKDVFEVIKGVFPDDIGKRVRAATRAAYLKQAEADNGWLTDEESGEKTRVATIVKGDPTGDFAFSGGKSEQRRAAVMEALRTDPELRAQVLGGALALGPGTEAGQDAAEGCEPNE